MDTRHPRYLSVKPLIVCFFFSILLSWGMYTLAQNPSEVKAHSTYLIPGLAAAQALLQLLLFLHLGLEENPRWNLIMFFFMVFVIVILVGGSLWIMANLDYNTMSM